MAICSPKLSLCGVILSAWGIVQLVSYRNAKRNIWYLHMLILLFQSLMGVFFYTNSVALIEDVPLEESYQSENELITDMDAGFQQVTFEIIAQCSKMTNLN